MASFLIIDPNPATRSVLRTLLTDAGHCVEAVGSLSAARGALNRARPHRIVIEAGHPRAGDFVRGLLESGAAQSGALCLVASAEDLETLAQVITSRDCLVVDRGLQDVDLIERLVSNLPTGDEAPAPAQGAGPQGQSDIQPADHRLDDDHFDPVYDVYKELGVAAVSTKPLLVYCDLHRVEQVIAPLTPAEQTELFNSLLNKMNLPVASYDGSLCMASRHGLSALFRATDDGEGRYGRGFHAAIEMVYIAQQFHAWLRQRFPGRGIREFAVSIALDAVDADDEQGDGEELDSELKWAITRLAQFATLGAKRGWSLTATKAALLGATEVCSAGESFSVRAGQSEATELSEVAAVALDSTTSVHERIARIMHANSALLRNHSAPPTAAPERPPDGPAQGSASGRPSRPAAPTPEKSANASGSNAKLTKAPEGIPDVESGLSVPGYRILRPLGKGGMAEVFLATHMQSGEERVLKMLPIVDGEEEQLQRFIQEYALISQIRDPNVALIFEQGFTHTHAYIAMEFLPGGELRAVMKRGLTVEQALDWTLAIAGALVAVHAKGITHRDLKPANLMLRADGTLALADFGIAKGQSDLLNRTANGHIVGSPYYLSPEQAESKPIDARCDLYSLGIMLFEMLTGTKPYRAANLSDLIRQHVVAPIPKLPSGLEQFQPLIDCLLAKKPSDRIGSAELLVAELKSLRGAFERTNSDVLAPTEGAVEKAAVRLGELYSVAVIGFDETEKIVLGSTLSLSIRRTPRFVEFDVNQGGRPDLYLVDARDMLYLQTMLSTNLDRAVPTVLIGNSDFGTRWPVLKRPIQWAKIFEAFDRILLQYEGAKASLVV